jgi:hypothetical protein
MRKQSLIHIHALCSALREDIQNRHDISGDPYEDYEEFGVKCEHIHRSKGEHKQALFRLFEANITAFELAEGETQPAPSAD